MSARAWAVSLSALGALGCETQAPAVAPSASPRPTIVLFLTDTLRADRLGVYGHRGGTSPELDSFAREAIVFEDAWASSSWTRPTVASLFTGLHPSRHRSGGTARGLAPRLRTLAELLADAGYRTAAVVANRVVADRFGFAQGFETWNEGDPAAYGVDAASVVASALRILDRVPGPLFLYVHTMEPHHPYEPSEAGWRRFRDGDEPRRPSVPLLKRHRLRAADVAYLDRLYQGEVWDNDRAFGSLVDGLRRRRRLDDSVVLFTADHGEEFLDHGRKGHGHSLYGELIRVPLVVRLPGARGAGRREAAPFSQVDLLPTLLSLVGVPSIRCDGRDLSALLRSASAPSPPSYLLSETTFRRRSIAAVRVGSLKLIRTKAAAVSPDDSLELYDLAADPGEKQNLVATRGQEARGLSEHLAALPGVPLVSEAEAQVELSNEDTEELRALGYVE